MKVPSVIVATFLAGCSAPGVEVWGGTTSKHAVGPYRFTVNHTRSRAEAYRTSAGWRMNKARVFEAAAKAMEQASGCKAPRGSLEGDVALIKGDLFC